MALYHEWDVKNGFAFLLQFFSLISDGPGGVLFYSNKQHILPIAHVKFPENSVLLFRYLAYVNMFTPPFKQQYKL